jgi:alkylation response protein AidB-like acyl-CoA dehydrogenase
MSGQPWSELFFDNAEIPVEDVVFDGNAFAKLMSTYSLERCAGAVTTSLRAQIAYDMAVEYAKERRQFGRPIAQFQMTQARLADMYMRLETARLFLYRAVAEGDESPRAKLNTSAAMVVATEAAAFVCEQAMNVFGGSGMSQDLPLEWLYRRVRPYWAAGGTNDIHRSMIAGEIVGTRIDHRPAVRQAS